MAAIVKDNQCLAYRLEGERGPFLVLYHGLLGEGEDWYRMGYVAVLQQHFRLLIPDARGHGYSGVPSDTGAYALETLVDDLAAMLDRLQIRNTHFFGVSLGALVGFALVQKHPSRLRVTLVGGESPVVIPSLRDYWQAKLNELRREGTAALRQFGIAPLESGPPENVLLENVLLESVPPSGSAGSETPNERRWSDADLDSWMRDPGEEDAPERESIAPVVPDEESEEIEFVEDDSASAPLNPASAQDASTAGKRVEPLLDAPRVAPLEAAKRVLNGLSHWPVSSRKDVDAPLILFSGQDGALPRMEAAAKHMARKRLRYIPGYTTQELLSRRDEVLHLMEQSLFRHPPEPSLAARPPAHPRRNVAPSSVDAAGQRRSTQQPPVQQPIVRQPVVQQPIVRQPVHPRVAEEPRVSATRTRS